MQPADKTAIIRVMAKLIINADDLGAGAETDRAIFETLDAGIVTSASLLVNGPSTDSAAAVLLARQRPVGVHINLSEGRPLSRPIDGLTTAEGAFPGKQATRVRLQTYACDLSALHREITAQIRFALDLGLTIDHLDSHQHVFLFPGVTEAIIDAAGQFGIGAVRLPLPRLLQKQPTDEALLGELELYQQLAPAAADKVSAAGLSAPQGLFGLDCLDRLNTELLEELLRAIPQQGCWELMVHPGHLDPDNPFSGPERELEWQALTAADTRNTIAACNIELISFGGLSCAS
jgi:predicted glycoside hydrolase/deacetylase ChbG (UPF0249 family)